MATDQERSTGTERLLKGFALLLAIPVLGLGLWLVEFFGGFAANVVAPGVSLWWRLFMLGTILIPVSAAFGLAQALSNRWVPAGAWFLVMGLGAAFWGPTGQLIALAPAGLGIAMLIRGMEARPRWSSPKEPKPRVDSTTSRDAREWTRSAVVVLLVILALGGASNGLRAYSRSRGVERVDELEQELRQQAQVCAASAAERVPYEPHDDRPLFSEHFTNCMAEYEPYRSCILSIPIRWCDINTGVMTGEPPGGTIDIGPYVDAALMEASGEPYDRAGELAGGRIDQGSIPLPPPDLTGQLERPLSRAVTIEEAIRMKGEPTWIRGVLVAQPHLGHRVLFCPEVEIRQSGEKSIHCSSGLIPEDGVIWTDAERSFVGAIENGIPRIVRWSNVGDERIQDCVFDDHMGTAPDSEVGSCSDLESRYSPTRNFFTLYSEVYGRVVGKPRSIWTDPYLAGHGLWRRNKGYTLLAASPGDTR